MARGVAGRDRAVDWPDGPIVGFDLETTGVDRFGDVPVSYALVTVEGGRVTRRVCGLVDPGREIPAGAMAVHGITTERARAEGRPLDEVVSMLVAELETAASAGRPIAGMRLDFDLTILDVQARRIEGRGLVERGWSVPVLDALVLDRHVDRFRKGRRTLGDLCAHYGVVNERAHDAGGDAEAAIAVIRAMSDRFPELARTAPDLLHRRQQVWHVTWARSYDRWRFEERLPALDARDYVWPIAPETFDEFEAAVPA